MKIRNGFISNSSSTCFIMDIRKPEVAKIVNSIIYLKIPKAEDLSRNTSYLIGREILAYANYHQESYGDYYREKDEFSDWLIKEFKKLKDNTVFFRKSDEDDIEFQEIKEELIESSMEYH